MPLKFKSAINQEYVGVYCDIKSYRTRGRSKLLVFIKVELQMI